MTIHPDYIPIMKTEKEKMLAGEIYDANFDAQLLAEREATAELCHDFNALRPRQKDEAAALLSRLLHKVGKGCTVLPNFYCDYGYNIELGNGVFINHNCVMLDEATIRLGSNVFIAPNCGFYTAGHPLEARERNLGLEYARPIVVEDDVWIGGGVTVLPGVTIGRGAVIGAGSIVNRDIPANALAVGNPCRPIRTIDNR